MYSPSVNFPEHQVLFSFGLDLRRTPCLSHHFLTDRPAPYGFDSMDVLSIYSVGFLSHPPVTTIARVGTLLLPSLLSETTAPVGRGRAAGRGCGIRGGGPRRRPQRRAGQLHELPRPAPDTVGSLPSPSLGKWTCHLLWGKIPDIFFGRAGSL